MTIGMEISIALVKIMKINIDFDFGLKYDLDMLFWHC